MANGNAASLEGVQRELENLGSLVRSLSTQVASVRVRVSDLEQWDRGHLKLQGKGKGKEKSKGKGKEKSKGKGKGKDKQPGKPPAPPATGKKLGKVAGKAKGYGR